MMYKGKKGKYVAAGLQATPSIAIGVRGSVHLPDSEAGASRYDPEQKPFYAETVQAQPRGPVTMPLNTALILLYALFVVFGVMALSRTVRKAALTKDITAMNQAIQATQSSNSELLVQLAEARDMARISYDAAHRLSMVEAKEADTVAVHAPDTRPFGDGDPIAPASAKAGSR